MGKKSSPDASIKVAIDPERRRRNDLSICIVNFNTKQHLKKCLTSIKKTKDLKLETIIVDNASTDGSSEMVKHKFPQVQLIKNSKNVLFSKAYNQAFTQARGKYVLILNSDTILPPNTLKKMADFMEKHSEAAAASCKQVDENGTLDFTCSRSPTPIIEFYESSLLGKVIDKKKLLSDYRYLDWKRDTTRSVDILSGSFMLVRSDVLRKLKGFDENLKLFYSDTDLCLRMKQAGYKLYHNAGVTITHLRAQSVKKLSSWQRQKQALQDVLTYYRKHFGFLWWLFLWLSTRPDWIYWRLKSFSNTHET